MWRLTQCTSAESAQSRPAGNGLFAVTDHHACFAAFAAGQNKRWPARCYQQSIDHHVAPPDRQDGWLAGKHSITVSASRINTYAKHAQSTACVALRLGALSGPLCTATVPRMPHSPIIPAPPRSHPQHPLPSAHPQHAIQGLFRGNGMNTLRLGPEVLLKFAVHDQLRILCGATAVDPSQISTPTRVAAASATGLLRTVLLQPLSVLRTRLTADSGAALRSPLQHASASPPAPSALAPPLPRLYHGIWHCARETWARERFAGLYRGAGAAAMTTVPYLAFCFGTYDVLSTQLPSDKHSQRQWWYPVAKMGTAAGAAPCMHW